MPIRPENKALYPVNWPAIRARILRRERQRCKTCRVKNYACIGRAARSTPPTFMYENGNVHHQETGKYLGRAKGSEYPATRLVKIILTVAHLDHDPTNNNDGNLAALCQLHHLRHDQQQHIASRAVNAARKAGQQTLPGTD